MDSKDKFSSSIEYKDKYTDFSYSGRSIIKQKYNQIQGIYLWVNNINNRSYVGKSVNIYQRLSKYFSPSYINNTKSKWLFVQLLQNMMLIILLCILETMPILSNHKPLDLSKRENHWYMLINPSYNLQSILQPFTGSNHYRFGSTVLEDVRLKISKTLKGRITSEEAKANHVSGARKKSVYCYDFNTNKYLMEFDGLRIAARALNIKDSAYIR